MKGFKVYGLLAAFAIAATMACAQDGPPPPQGGGGYGGPGMEQGPRRPMGPPPLFLRPDAQKELKLTDEQIEKLRALMPPPPGAQGGGGRGMGRPGQGGRAMGDGGRPQQGNRELEPPRGDGPGRMEDQLSSILNDGQIKRLKELQLQMMGAQALCRKDVADKVGLSDEERSHVREIIDDAMQSMPRPQPGERPDFEAMRRAHEEMKARLNDKILGGLSSGQRAKWQALLGKPFRFDENWRPPQPPDQDGPPPPMGGGANGGGQ